MSELTDDKAELAGLMSELSERCYCAGWLDGLEFTLWDYVCGQSNSGVWSMIEPDELTQLTKLAASIGGWIFWHPDHAATFIPLAEWLEMYRQDRHRSAEEIRATFEASEPFTADELHAILMIVAKVPDDSLRQIIGCLSSDPERILYLRDEIRQELKARHTPEAQP
jgi:hypothetical protein